MKTSQTSHKMNAIQKEMKKDIWGKELLDAGIEILEIRRRNLFWRILTINRYNVKVRYDKKLILNLKCWGALDFTFNSLFYDIADKLRSRAINDRLNGVLTK